MSRKILKPQIAETDGRVFRKFFVSGNLLESNGGTRKTFSPLFIGELPATFRKFQTFNRNKFPFSPLFIGELPATYNRHHDDDILINFQSPLHWGITCNVAELG